VTLLYSTTEETRNKTRKIALLLCALAGASDSSAATIGTGSAPWQVNGSPAVATTTQFNYFVPFGGATWIGVNANGSVVPGIYTFTLDIGTLIGGPGVFNLSYGADNSVGWSITNGSLAGTLSCLNPGGDCFGPGATPTTVPALLSGTFSGASVLTATVINDGGTPNPMALFAAGTASAVPEPSTWILAFLPIIVILQKSRWLKLHK